MKQFKIAIISLAAVVVAVLGFFIIREIVINNTPHSVNKLNATLTNNLSSDVIEMTLYNGGSKFTFNKRDEKVLSDTGEMVTENVWYLVGEEDISIDQNVVNTLAIITSNLVAKDIIAENPSDLTDYGFTDESTYVNVKLKGNKEFTVTLGSILFDRSGYYIMRDGDTTVYSTSLYSANSMLITRAKLLEMDIFPGVITDVTSFSLTKNDILQFTIVPDETYYWVMTQPIIFRCDPTKTDEIVNNTFAMMIKEYIDITPEDLNIYGLDNPKYVLTLNSLGKEVKLMIGNENLRDFSYYAMIDGKGEVFSIASDTLNFLDTPALDVIWPFPFTPMLQYVAKVDIQVAERKLLFEIGTNEELQVYDYKFNGESINNFDTSGVTFGKFFYTLLISPFATAIEPQGIITGTPYCEMTFTYTDGNYETIAYYKTEYDDTKLYAVRNGNYTGLVTDIDFFRDSLALVIDKILDGSVAKDLAPKETESSESTD
ncbi:MAG: DUF4340 domain-containing protein [Clostridia bacterium]|nr:DUF4340 domain-containing protein [Clostridia bacterium]